MRRGALISFLIHVAILMAILIVLPPEPLPQSADDSVDVDLVGPNAPQQSTDKGPVPALTKTAVAHQAPPAKNPPKPQTIVAPPPPPPPPPPAPPKPATVQPPTPAPPPPPPVMSPTATPQPPPPPPKPPQKTTSTAVQPKLPMPPVTQPPAPAQSPTHQQQVVKTPAPLSKSVLNTLMKLEAIQKQDKPPTAVYNPDQGGAPNAGGSTKSTSNSGLTGADRDAIGNHVRPCWNIDAGAPGVAGFNIQLLVTTDAGGVVRQAVVAPQDQGKLSDPIQAAYANDAINAVMNYQCANLPLPPDMMGKINTFLFDFTP